MEEIRIDVTKQTEEELALASEHAQLIFKFNHAMPGTSECAERNDEDEVIQLGLDSCGD